MGTSRSTEGPGRDELFHHVEVAMMHSKVKGGPTIFIIEKERDTEYS